MFKSEETDVEAGAYRARLKDIEEFTGTKYQSDEPQAQFKFIFELLEEGYEGQTLTRNYVNAETFAPSSTARMIVEGVLGRRVEKGEEIQKADIVGRECDLSVSINTTDRGTFANVDKVMPVRTRRRSAEAEESKQLRDVKDGRVPVKEGAPETEEDFESIPF